jgi:CHRD domain
MQHREGVRRMGRVGACLAFISSILMFAGSASAAAEVGPPHRNGDQFVVPLSGDELRDGGDRDGEGAAWLDLDAERETVCYVTTWKRLDGAVTAFHLHAAPRRSDGPRWIDFFNDQRFDGERNRVSGCVYSPRGKILDVIAHPSDFYLNLHTTAYEKGAIRGQLG